MELWHCGFFFARTHRDIDCLPYADLLTGARTLIDDGVLDFVRSNVSGCPEAQVVLREEIAGLLNRKPAEAWHADLLHARITIEDQRGC